MFIPSLISWFVLVDVFISDLDYCIIKQLYTSNKVFYFLSKDNSASKFNMNIFYQTNNKDSSNRIYMLDGERLLDIHQQFFLRGEFI